MNRNLLLFFRFIALMLFFTAVAKLYSATGSVRILEMEDPIFHVSYRHLMLGVAIIELAIVAFLTFGRDVLLKAAAVFWLSSNFLLYRAGMKLLNIEMCPCVGAVTDKLPISRAQLESILAVFVALMFVGSGLILWRKWVERQHCFDTTVGGSKEAPLLTLKL